MNHSRCLPFLVAIALLLATAHPATALQTARPQSAPWRASFSELNRDAADQQSAPNSAAWKPAQMDKDRPAVPATAAREKSAADQAPGLNPTEIKTPNVGSAVPASASHVDHPMTAGVKRTLDKLPNDAGQVWREYDITPYTDNVTSVDNPQQSILDWILRETGNEMWFNQPLGILNADRKRLIVYHTPEIQDAVKEIVDRFVRTRGQLQSFNVNLVTVANPSWRASAYPLLQTIDVKSPGVEAWLVSKENAALLYNQLKNRPDFKSHSGDTVSSHDGQSLSLERTRPVPFVRSIRWMPGTFPGFEPLMTTINEGYTVGISPLTSLDNQTIEVAIKCDVDQVESLTPVKVPVNTGNAIQQINLNVPRVISWRLQERFRWPASQVLVLSCGVVVDPDPEAGSSVGPLRAMGINAFSRNQHRSDALLMIEYRGPSNGASLPRTAGRSNLQSLAK